MWGSEDNQTELILSFHHVDLWNLTQTVRLGRQYLCPPSHGPYRIFLIPVTLEGSADQMQRSTAKHWAELPESSQKRGRRDSMNKGVKIKTGKCMLFCSSGFLGACHPAPNKSHTEAYS